MRIYSTQFLMNQFKAILSDLAYPLTITGRAKRYLNDYQIHGNSVQDVDPTPDAPVEVQSVGDIVTEGEYIGKYKIPVVVSGKNLFDKNNLIVLESYRVSGRTTTDTGIQWTYTYSSSEYSRMSLNLGAIKDYAGKTLCVRFVAPAELKYNNTRLFVRSVEGTDTNLRNATVSNGTVSIIYAVPESYANSDSTLALALYISDLTETRTITLDYFQIEYDNHTDFEPYVEPVTTDIYLDAPLRKIGDYADYIDFKGKRAVRRVKEVVVTGTEYWSTQGDSYANDTTCFFASGASFASGRHTLGTWASNRDLCNMLPRQSRHPQASSITTECFGIHPTESLKGYAYFRIKKSRLAGNTAEAFKAWLKDLHSNGTPMKVYYALEESVNEAIELPKVLQFKGQNTYTVETTITPSGLQVKYY